jgi:hypothetical protein
MSTKRKWCAGAIRRAGASRAPCENGVEPRCRARRPLAAAKACAAKDRVRPGPEDEPPWRAAVPTMSASRRVTSPASQHLAFMPIRKVTTL